MTCIQEVSHCQASNQRGILSYLSRWPQKEKRGESVSSSTTWHFQRIEPLISRKPKVPRAASTICLVLGESTWQLRLPSPFHFIFVQGTGCQSSDKFVSQWPYLKTQTFPQLRPTTKQTSKIELALQVKLFFWNKVNQWTIPMWKHTAGLAQGLRACHRRGTTTFI